jgi:hypothetical protein
MSIGYPEDRAARAEARSDAAEVERDAAINIAANESVRADANAAAANVNAAYADAARTDAVIAARQADALAAETSTHNHILSHELAHERAAASNNAFGFYLTLGILVAGMMVAGIYLWWRNQNPDSVTVLAAPPPVTQNVPPPVTVMTPPPPVVINPPAPVTTPPPTNINVNPPAQTPPANSGEGETNPSSRSGSGGTDNFGAGGATETQETPRTP